MSEEINRACHELIAAADTVKADPRRALTHIRGVDRALRAFERKGRKSSQVDTLRFECAKFTLDAWLTSIIIQAPTYDDEERWRWYTRAVAAIRRCLILYETPLGRWHTKGTDLRPLLAETIEGLELATGAPLA